MLNVCIGLFNRDGGPVVGIARNHGSRYCVVVHQRRKIPGETKMLPLGYWAAYNGPK